MSLAILSDLDAQPLLGLSFDRDRAVVVNRYAGSRKTQRAELEDRDFHDWELSFTLDADGQEELEDFFRDLAWTRDHFLWRVPEGVAWHAEKYRRTGLSLGLATSGQTVFALPVSGAFAGEYPANNGFAKLYDDGVAITTTVQTDARTLTGSPGMALNSVATCDYDFYRRFRLAERFRWELDDASGLWRARLRIVEEAA